MVFNFRVVVERYPQCNSIPREQFYTFGHSPCRDSRGERGSCKWSCQRGGGTLCWWLWGLWFWWGRAVQMGLRIIYLCVWERRREIDWWLSSSYFWTVNILAQRPTDISAVATVLVVTKTFIVKYYDRRIQTNPASIIIITQRERLCMHDCVCILCTASTNS